MQHDLTNLQKKNERRLPAVAKSFLYESKRNFWSYTMKFQIRHTKTPASQYQPIDRKKRKGKIVEDNSRDRAAYANKKALALLLKLACPTPSNTGLARSIQRDREK